MKKTFIGLGLAVVLLLSGCSQSAETFVISNEINVSSEMAMEVIEELVKPEYKGRLAGTEENEKATQYIEEQFATIGLEKVPGLEGYRQSFPMTMAILQSEPKFEVVNEKGEVIKEYKFLEDFNCYFEFGGRISGNTQGEMATASGLSELTRATLNYKDKIALISAPLGGSILEVQTKLSESRIPLQTLNGIVIGMPSIIEGMDHPYKLPVSPAMLDMSRHAETDPLFMMCTQKVMDELKAYQEASQNNQLRLGMDYESQEVMPSNVVGMIPGSDPELKDEYVIVSAHFDHVGDNENGTYNPGALDNSSGTGAMLAIAKAIKDNPTPPKKTIVFVAFNGEEEGVYGSKHFVENLPLPMKTSNTICINLDMVGSANMTRVNLCSKNIHSEMSKDLMALAKKVKLDVSFEASGGSDHSPFNEAGYQSVTLINPDFSSGYHSPADTIEDVSEQALQEVLDFVLIYLRNVAY